MKRLCFGTLMSILYQARNQKVTNNLLCDAIFSSYAQSYEGRSNQGIYKYFRNEYMVYGDVLKPTGATKGKEFISLKGTYNFSWKSAGNNKKYFMIEV